MRKLHEKRDNLETVKIYLQHLTLYDYIGFIFVGIVFFFLFLIGAILLFKRRFLLSFLILFLSILIIPIGLLSVKYLTDKTLREASVRITKIEPLHFSNSTLIKLKIKNISKIDYSRCYITFKFYKKSKNRIKTFFYNLKPITKKTIFIEHYLSKNSFIEVKNILDNISFNAHKESYKVDNICY